MFSFGPSSLLHASPGSRVGAAASPPGSCRARWPCRSFRRGRPDEQGHLARALGEPAVVIGHSTGGALAQELALAHPDVVAGLVLVDTGPDMHEHGDAGAILRHPHGVVARPGRGDPRPLVRVAATARGARLDARLRPRRRAAGRPRLRSPSRGTAGHAGRGRARAARPRADGREGDAVRRPPGLAADRAGLRSHAAVPLAFARWPSLSPRAGRGDGGGHLAARGPVESARHPVESTSAGTPGSASLSACAPDPFLRL